MAESTEVERRLEALEAAVAEIRAAAPVRRRSGAAPDLWLIDEVAERHPAGAVIFGGALTLPTGEPVRWQYGLPAEAAQRADWAQLAPALDALGHPVRLTILQLVYAGVRTTAALAEQESLGSTGQLHHHLRILVSAGWLTHRARGEYEIPGPRVVPLLAALLAAYPA